MSIDYKCQSSYQNNQNIWTFGACVLQIKKHTSRCEFASFSGGIAVLYTPQCLPLRCNSVMLMCHATWNDRMKQLCFSTSIYRKKTFTVLYTKRDSFTPRKYKINLIRTLTCRCLRICSSTPCHAKDTLGVLLLT